MIDEAYGVFVSPSGDDAGAGTQSDPYKSLAKGVSSARAAGKRMYVCADGGSFDETLALNASSAGVEAYGSIACADWTYNSALKAGVTPSAEGYALTVDSVNAATLLDGFEFTAQGATLAGGSSVAGFVKGSSGLTLRHVKLVAQDAMAGADSVTAAYSQPSGLDGGDANLVSGGTGTAYAACAGGGTTQGGLGGSLSLGGGTGSRAPGTNPLNGGTSGSACTGGGFGAGGPGAPGTEGPPGAPAATHGTLSATGWQPSTAGNGVPGLIGQGGGGGRGGTSGGGGGGGAGGCGGAAGAGAQGGGSSIALLLFNSPVTLSDVELVSAGAGAGGKGSDGQDGLLAGLGGGRAGTAGTNGCDGGDGGQGGPGGGGAGGAGGLSVGILHLGAAPMVTGGSITPGAAGAAGVGGKAGPSGAKAADGLAGVAESIRAVSN